MRIWRTSTGAVSTRVSKRTSGPRSCDTLAVNGMFVACPVGTSTRQTLPPYDVMIALESGVKAEPG